MNGGAAIEARVAQNVNAEYVKLAVPARTIEPISATALQVRDAIKRGDYDAASKISNNLLEKDRLSRWRFSPFATFMVNVTDVLDPVYAAHLNEWAARDPKDAIPLLMRAKLEDDIAWFRRGNNTVNLVAEEDMRSFGRYRRQASDDVDEAIRLNPDIPFAYFLQLHILYASGPSERYHQAFSRAIAKDPDDYVLYSMTLAVLQPRWGGLTESMAAFADQFAGPAPQDSPLKLLYLELYSLYLSSASFDCSESTLASMCVLVKMHRVMTPDLERKMGDAWRLYDLTDKAEFDESLDPIVSILLDTRGGDFQIGAFLQQMAEAMHIKLQLTHEGVIARPSDAKQPLYNEYMLAKSLGRFWLKQGFYNDALTAARAALADTAKTSFPSETMRNDALAGVYTLLADIYAQTRQFPAEIAAEKAAIAIHGAIEPHDTISKETNICYAYYQLAAYVSAKAACNEAITEDSSDMKAYFWRGMSRMAIEQMGPAKQDFTVVAETNDPLRSDAVNVLSAINLAAKDFQGVLDILNRYTYIYDPNVNNDQTISFAYNTRCSAYMALGQLQKALTDCNASLAHMENPEIRRRIHDIEQKLGPQQAGQQQTDSNL